MKNLHKHGILTLLAAAAHAAIDTHRSATRTNYRPKRFDDLGDDIKNVRINGVLAALRDDMTPQKLHEIWLEDMTKAGWTPGAVTDSEAKTNVNMITYGDLSENIRIESQIFIGIIRDLSPLAGIY